MIESGWFVEGGDPKRNCAEYAWRGLGKEAFAIRGLVVIPANILDEA